MSKTSEIQDTLIFTYFISSADMRYIEIGRRDIYLRNDPKMGQVFQGEISGCMPGCFIDLGEILLEYAMSCEGWKDQSVTSEEVVHFGEQIGDILVTRNNLDLIELPIIEKLSSVFKCILNSMSVTYIEDSKEDRLEYSLDCCPLSECAKATGLSRSLEMAHLSFTALCNKLITTLAPGWVLVQPTEEDARVPIHRIVIDRL